MADGASGLLMYLYNMGMTNRRTKKIDCVLFGADRVTANGDVANKIGTYNVSECVVVVNGSSRWSPTKTTSLFMLLCPLPQSTFL